MDMRLPLLRKHKFTKGYISLAISILSVATIAVAVTNDTSARYRESNYNESTRSYVQAREIASNALAALLTEIQTKAQNAPPIYFPTSITETSPQGDILASSPQTLTDITKLVFNLANYQNANPSTSTFKIQGVNSGSASSSSWEIQLAGTPELKSQIINVDASNKKLRYNVGVSATAYVGCDNVQKKTGCTVAKVTSNTSLYIPAVITPQKAPVVPPPGLSDSCLIFWDPTLFTSEGQCFWMENVTQEWCWVPVNKNVNASVDVNTCRQLDGCTPGNGNLSGGGCYKWAKTPTEASMHW
jgi:hypothetical protein